MAGSLEKLTATMNQLGVASLRMEANFERALLRASKILSAINVGTSRGAASNVSGVVGGTPLTGPTVGGPSGSTGSGLVKEMDFNSITTGG